MMTKTEQLLALCEAATSPYADDWELKKALHKFDVAANPAKIRRMVEVMEMMREALGMLDYGTRFDEATEAIAAFDAWQKGWK